MSVDCWSVSAGSSESEQFLELSDGILELATLSNLPLRVLLTAKATFQSLGGKDVMVIKASLYFDKWLVDSSYVTLGSSPPQWAGGLVLHGTIDRSPSRRQSPQSLKVKHKASLRMETLAGPNAFTIVKVWLTAIRLDTLSHTGPFPTLSP
jgi:hypothetical protein